MIGCFLSTLFTYIHSCLSNTSQVQVQIYIGTGPYLHELFLIINYHNTLEVTMQAGGIAFLSQHVKSYCNRQVA